MDQIETNSRFTFLRPIFLMRDGVSPLTIQSAKSVLVFLCVYVFVDMVARTFSNGPMSVTPWNPAIGVGVAFLVVAGLGWTPVMFMALLCSEFVAVSLGFAGYQSLTLPLLSTIGYAALAGMLRIYRPALGEMLTRTRDVIVFVLATAGITLLLAGLSLLVHAATHSDWRLEATRLMARYWIGDLLGVLVFLPLTCLIWKGRGRPLHRSDESLLHIVGIFIATMLAFYAFYGKVPGEQITSLHLMFLPLIWAALRFGQSGALLLVLVIQLGVVILSNLGSEPESTVIEFQIRMLAIALTGLFFGTVVDERIATEIQLRERQGELDRTLRLASSVELASAMAHELNQPLSALSIYAQTCELMLRDTSLPEIRETMGKIGIEARRAGEVVHRLRDFYRSGGSALKNTGVAALIDDAVDSIEARAMRYQVVIRQDCDPHLPMVSIDRIQIQMALHNLLANAIDAMRDANSPERLIGIVARMANKSEVCITVSDTGPGINAQAVDSLFRPFNSTKTYGLGLGLSMSRSIVNAHGGELRSIPSPSGCIIEMTLPVLAQ